MLRLMVDAKVAGEYAVPSRLIQSAHFIAIAISTTVFPRLVQAYKADIQAFSRLMQLSFCVLLLTAYAVICGVALLGDWLLPLVFGDAYAGTAHLLLLLLLSLSLPFAFCRYLTTRWIIVARKGRYLIYSEGLGAAVNIVLNLWLVPRYGGAGAAMATLCAYVMSALLSLLAVREGREVFVIIVQSMLNPVAPLTRFWQQRRSIAA